MSLSSMDMGKIISAVMQEVLKQSIAADTNYGVYDTIGEAVEASYAAQQKLSSFTVQRRREFIAALREAALAKAELLAEMTVEETGMGRVADKIIKNKLAAQLTPGTEDLRTEAYTGDKGLTLVEMAPFGIIGSITPVTNPVATIINNAIGMIAAGNSVVFCPHPGAKNTAQRTIEILNKAVISRGGPADLLCTIKEPGIKAVQELMSHPKVSLICATGGPDVVKAALSSGKKAIGAGAGNPPVVVDETADIEKAARDIVSGATFDNNLPCISEKSVIVVGQVADMLLNFMQKNGVFPLSGEQVSRLEKLVLVEKRNVSGCVKYYPEKQFVGKDAKVILGEIGIKVDDSIRGIMTEVSGSHPFVLTELMMPIIPVVQVKNIAEAIALAVKVEDGNRHTAIMHSKNVDNMTSLARAIQTTVFVKNAPSYAGIGVGAEGYTTFTIAGPTGEGLTSARTFTRIRKCVLVDALSIV